MNNTYFTTAQIRQVLPTIVDEGRGVTENLCGFDPSLCEISFENPEELEIVSVELDNGVLDIHFNIIFDPGDSEDYAGEGWTWRYQTLIEESVFKSYL